MDEVWLDEPDRRARKEQLGHQHQITEERECSKWVDHTPSPDFGDSNDAPPPLAPVVSDSESDSEDNDTFVPGDMSVSGGVFLDNPPPAIKLAKYYFVIIKLFLHRHGLDLSSIKRLATLY